MFYTLDPSFSLVVHRLFFELCYNADMSHEVLYRKYRPQTFKDVISQDHIVKVLESSIKLGNISHAYLFAGSRGTGKTSIARIFAKEIGTSANDIYEIDAASNTGVENIRDLKESANTLPFESQYKVYILDEAHMLSKSAFNAFLKLLEEPPQHVIFILATTEIEKIPGTIISRCQVFNFKRPTQKILRESILRMAKSEGYTIEGSSAELIAILSDGSFRDSQMILQKVIGGSRDKKISEEEVEIVTGAPRGDLINNFIKSISEKDTEKGIEALKKASTQNIDMKIFGKLLLQKLRQILLIRYSKDMMSEIEEEVSERDFEFLLEMSKINSINSRTLMEFLKAYDVLGKNFIPELPLELALINLTQTN